MAPLRSHAALRQHALTGGLLVMGGAMLFACKGLFAKALYADGVPFEAVVCIRAVISLPLFWAFALARDGASSIRGTRPRAYVAAALAGFLCYYVGAMCDFYALTLIAASVERVLLFSYPAMVVLASSLLARAWPARRVATAVFVTYLGIFLVMGGFDLRVLLDNYVGASWVFLTAFTYAIYFMISERYTREIGATRFSLFAMTASTVALVVHVLVHPVAFHAARLGLRDWLMLGGIGILCQFIPVLMQAEGVRRIGAQRGSVLSTAGPPTTLVLAWFLLGERMSAWQLSGVALIVAGILILDLARSAPKVVEE